MSHVSFGLELADKNCYISRSPIGIALSERARSLARFDSVLCFFKTENMRTADNREARRSNRLGPIILSKQ
jgi:hypothetical protein